MPIDANIALGIRPVEPVNMLGQMGQMMAIRQAQQEFEGSEGVNELARQGNKDPNAYLQYGKQGRATYESILKGQKDLREGQKLEVDLGIAKIGAFRDQLNANVNDPAAAARWLTAVNGDPLVGKILSSVPLQDQIAGIPTDPKGFADWKNRTMLKAPDFVKHFVESADAQLSSRTSLATNAATVGATMRGQDITDKRTREQLHPIETGAGPGTYRQFGADAGVIRPMSQAPWSPPPSAVTPSAVTPSAAPAYGVGGGPLGSGTFGMTPTGPNTLRTAPPVNMMSQGAQPPATAPTGLTQATPKPPTSVVNVNTQTTASEEAQKEFMKSSRATYDQLKQAPTLLDNIEKAKALVSTAKGFMGTGGETMLEAVKFMNNRLGTSIDIAGVKGAEELNSRLFMGILDNLKKLDAQPSQQQQAAMKQALGNLGTDPNAMNAVLDVFGDIVRGKVDIHNREVTDAEARGTKFPYNPVIKLKERTPASTGDITTDASVAKVIKSNAEYNALPSGATFTAPDGTTRRKP